jgi:RNA polymerase primary sigma factor
LQAIVENSRIVRMPLNKVGSYNKVNEAYISFVQEFEREPTDEELGELLEMSPREVQTMMRSGIRHVSFDAPLANSEDGESTMLDVFMSEDAQEPDIELMAESLREEVAQGLSILSPREVEVIASYYGLNGYKPLNLEEIGELYGLTRERVRQIKERAIRRLRKAYNRNSLKSYLG